MPGLIYYQELKQALGLSPEAQLASVEKALRKLNIPFEYGVHGVFTTEAAMNRHILGEGYDDKTKKTTITGFVDS